MTTIFEVEVHAVDTCAEMLKKQLQTTKSIIIFSGGQAALKGLEYSGRNSKTTKKP